MEGIKDWSVIISAVAIVSGIFIMLIPESKLKEAYKIMVTTLVIYSVLLPIVNNRYDAFDLNSLLQENTELKNKYYNESYDVLKESAEDVLEREITSALKSENLNAVCSVTCVVENENFSVEEIVITGRFSDTEKNAISDLLKDYKTEGTKVVFAGE